MLSVVFSGWWFSLSGEPWFLHVIRCSSTQVAAGSKQRAARSVTAGPRGPRLLLWHATLPRPRVHAPQGSPGLSQSPIDQLQRLPAFRTCAGPLRVARALRARTQHGLQWAAAFRRGPETARWPHLAPALELAGQKAGRASWCPGPTSPSAQPCRQPAGRGDSAAVTLSPQRVWRAERPSQSCPGGDCPLCPLCTDARSAECGSVWPACGRPTHRRCFWELWAAWRAQCHTSEGSASGPGPGHLHGAGWRL